MKEAAAREKAQAEQENRRKEAEARAIAAEAENKNTIDRAANAVPEMKSPTDQGNRLELGRGRSASRFEEGANPMSPKDTDEAAFNTEEKGSSKVSSKFSLRREATQRYSKISDAAFESLYKTIKSKR